MATVTNPKPTAAEGYVDFDEFIDFQISKTRGGIKATDLLTAVMGAGVGVLAYVLVFALFDHWVIAGGFSTGVRVALLCTLAAGLLAWIGWKVVWPYFRQVTPLYAAQQIEQMQPELQNTLLTLVDLKRSGRSVDGSIEAALEKRSAVSLSQMNVDEAVDRRVLMRLSYVLFALVMLTCAYVLLSPKKLSNSLWRALLPTSSVTVATRTRIDNVLPGDVELLARSQLEVTADLSGEVPEQVTLVFSTADRRFVDEPVTMRESDDGLRRFRGVITGENGAGILQNLTYRVIAGDAVSPEYTAQVNQAPSATVQEVHYEYPAYMGVSDRTQVGGSVDAWEGTWVTVRATANMPLKSALLMFSDTEDTSQKAEEIPATIEPGNQLTARWRLRIRGDGSYPAFYRLQCRNQAGETDVEPTLYAIKIRPDLPPKIELVQPTGDLERPANAIVPLLYAAEDPDFLLRSVILFAEVNGEALPQQPRLFQAPPFRQSLHDVYEFDLSTIELQPGDRLTYWLEARDNMEPFADRSGNRANTPKLNVTISEPASPEAVQEQLEQDQQQIAKALDDASTPRADQPSDGTDPPADRPEEMPPPADPAQPAEPGGTPPPPASDDGSTQPQDGSPQDSQSQPSDGQPGEAGAGQTGSGASQEGQPQDASQSGGAGPSDAPNGDSQPSGGDASENDPASEEGFDNLLKRMVQREQQRQEQRQDQQPEGESGKSDRNAQPQSPSGAEGQPHGDQPGADPSPADQGPSGPSQPAAGSKGTEGTKGPDGGSGQSADQPGGQRDAPSSMNRNQPATPEGTPQGTPEGTPQGTPNTTPSPGETPEGQPQPGDATKPPAGTPPANDTPSQGGQKQSGNDATGAKPGDGKTTEGVPPQPGQPPKSLSDQPGPKPGEPLKNPDAKSGGQPDGPDEPLRGEGDPQGQRSDKPQTGEGGDSQQTSQGNRGGDQKGPGDSTGEPGMQEKANGKEGEPGKQPGAGSQSQSGDAQPGKNGADSKSEPTGPGESVPPESGRERSKGAGGDQPSEMSDSTPSGQSGDKPQPGPGEGQPGEGQPGEGQPGEGQPGQGQPGQGQPGEGQPGEGQPGEGQPGEGQPGEGQPGKGGEAGSPPASGTPGGAGGGTQSDGGHPIDRNSPAGMGAGNDTPADGNAAAGEGAGAGPSAADPDLEAKRKAANLVLDRLQDQLQRGEIDPQLQEDLNLTPEQLREFTQKLEERLADLNGDDGSPEAQARRRQFEETLRTIDYDSQGTTRAGGDGPRESSAGFAGPNRPAPPQHRDAARLYRERLQQKQRGR